MHSPPKRNVITVDIPSDLVEYCDQAAQKLCLSRSAFIRTLIIQARNQEQK